MQVDLDLARRFVQSFGVEADRITEAGQHTEKVVGENWSSVIRLAEAVLAKGTVYGNEAKTLIGE